MMQLDPFGEQMLEARAIAAALAECGVQSISTVTRAGESQLCARETDLPTALIELCETGGELVAGSVRIRWPEDGVGTIEITDAEEAFTEAHQRARRTLRAIADRTA